MPVTASETAALLLRRQAKRKEADRARADRVRQTAVEAIRRRLPAGARAWLFGSIAWGGFGARSDVDVAVEGVTPAEAASLELHLVSVLGLHVDLLRVEELPAPFVARIREHGDLVDA